MNPYQSTLYQLTESVGAVSMVSIDQIKKQQNLDYLEHLCTFIDRMNINPIWFENQDNSNKLKILEIYQLAITYSNNLSTSYEKNIQEKEAEIRRMRDAQKEKTRQIRNHKDDYQNLKQRYKLKKHQIYKFMYDNLRNRMREEDSYRDTRRDHRDQRSQTAPQIVYYYPQQNDPMRYDPAFHAYPPPPNAFPPNQFDPRMWPPNHPPPHQNQPYSNPYTPANPIHQQSLDVHPPSTDTALNKFLSNGHYGQFHERPQLILTNSKIISPKHRKSESPKNEDMQKSKIIASGEKLYEKMEEQLKKKSQKSISEDNGDKKLQKQSLFVQPRSDDDDFGNLTVNSRKKNDSIKLMKKDSGLSLEQEQFDSIAHIKLGSQSSAKMIGANPPKSFESKIYGKQEKQIKPATAAPSSFPSRITEVTAEGQTSTNQNQLDGVKNIMQSVFSKNNSSQEQGERMYQNPPKRNSQAVKTSTVKSQIGQSGKVNEDIRKSNQSSKNQSAKIPQKSKVNDPVAPKALQTPTQKSQKHYDIFKSNIGGASSNKDKRKDGQVGDIYSSNMGHSGNSKYSEGQKLFTEKMRPKRSGQSETPPPVPSSTLEVPDFKKSNANHLRISVAESEQMLYSQANSIRFSKEPAKTPPKLEKQDDEEQNYEDDFDIDDIELEKSHLPISQHRPTTTKLPEKSEVNIHISAIPTAKEIVKEKYAVLPNQTFELKSNNQSIQNPNKFAASSSMNESDNFFDEILQMPMNSRIAQRPAIHKFETSSAMPQSVDSLKKLIDSGKIGSAGNIPSIHVIDPTGHMERVQERGGKKEESSAATTQETPLFAEFASEKDRINTSRSSNLADFNNESKILDGKQTSLFAQNKNQQLEVKPQKKEKFNSSSEDELNLELVEQSSIEPNSKSKKEEKKKLEEVIARIEAQPPAYKDSRGFDEGWFDKILKDQFKAKVNDIKSAKKWEDIERYYKQQYEKVKELQERPRQDKSKQGKSENASTPKSIQRQSNYDDLQYSQSNLKMENKSSKGQTKRQLSLDPVKDMTESITIKEVPKVEQKVTFKTVENKYSRSGKPKTQIKGDLSKNINVGKNAYDVDDPLNVAAFQNRKLLEQQQESESDF